MAPLPVARDSRTERVCNRAVRGLPRAQNRAARLRTLPGLVARFCTPYEFVTQ